jgi:hypothetical protein
MYAEIWNFSCSCIKIFKIIIETSNIIWVLYLNNTVHKNVWNICTIVTTQLKKKWKYEQTFYFTPIEKAIFCFYNNIHIISKSKLKYSLFKIKK